MLLIPLIVFSFSFFSSHPSSFFCLFPNSISLGIGLDDWIRPEKPSVGLINKADNCQIRSQPKGVVLIIGAWNYPIQLTLLPLVGAIAAGNAVIIKPSEVKKIFFVSLFFLQHFFLFYPFQLATATAELLGILIPKYLDKECFRVINGGLAETTCVLEQQFDHILYTGLFFFF